VIEVTLGTAATVKGGNGVRVIVFRSDPLMKPFSLAITWIIELTTEFTRGAVKLDAYTPVLPMTG
jgi:hypothetical protein